MPSRQYSTHPGVQPTLRPLLHRQPFLTLKAATFRLGDTLIFKDTSWIFGRQEHWAILGVNGSGKSLFADALRGLLPLVHGELRYHFRSPRGLSPEETIGHVAFEDRQAELAGTVVQSRWNSLEEERALLVRDFLSYERVMEINPFEMTGRHGPARAQFALRRQRAAALLQLAPLLDRRLLSLSNGETQRLHLARALCHPLRLLILDDPFAGLDTANRQRLQHTLERLMETPLRVLFITTRDEQLSRQVTHVLRVDHCRVEAAGPRAEILPGNGAVWTKAIRRCANLPPITNRCYSRPAVGATPSQESAAGHLVELRHVTVRYGSTTILRSLDWTIRAGESWALLGPNGSGKTTLLSVIQGDNPQAYLNHVVVFGRQRGSGESIWELKRHIGWVSPELHLHFDHAATCFAIVASGFRDTVGLFEPPTPRQRAAASRWLAKFDLLQFARTPLSALSTGLQRMVFLARALVKQPRLLILDEPCQGLDAAHQRLFMRTVDKLIRARRITVIYVTHRDEEIPPSIKKVLRLSANSR